MKTFLDAYCELNGIKADGSMEVDVSPSNEIVKAIEEMQKEGNDKLVKEFETSLNKVIETFANKENQKSDIDKLKEEATEEETVAEEN